MRKQWVIAAAVGLVLLLTAMRAGARSVMSAVSTSDPVAGANRAAMLWALRWSEGTDDANGYRALYGHTKAAPKLFGSFAQHPVESGEWRGEKLSDAMCAGAGLGPGCITTAAGAYQTILPTWREGRDALGLGDFSPASQDALALWLIDRAGALDDVDAGDLDTAISKMRRIWASLPGAGYDQPERSLAALRSVYQAAGGSVA